MRDLRVLEDTAPCTDPRLCSAPQARTALRAFPQPRLWVPKRAKKRRRPARRLDGGRLDATASAASFAEITEFVREHDREPAKAATDAAEVKLFFRSEAMRANGDQREALDSHDEFLLLAEPEPPGPTRTLPLIDHRVERSAQ